MPIVAIAAAAISIGTAATSFIAAGSVITGMVALEATAALGATLGAVGAVTGNKALQTAGMVIGGVGAIGALAGSVGLLGSDISTAPLFGPSAAASTADAASTAAAGVSQADALPTEAAAAGGPAAVGETAAQNTDIIDSLQTANTTADLPTAADTTDQALAGASGVGDTPLDSALGTANTTAPGSAVTAAGAPDSSIPSGASNYSATVPGASTAPIGQDAVTAPTGAANATPPGMINAMNPGNVTAQPTMGNIGPSGLTQQGFSPIQPGPNVGNLSGPADTGGFLNFIQNNPMVGYGLVQTASSFLSGATNPLTPAQVTALDAQAAANRAAASMSTMQQANIAQPMPTLIKPPTAAPVTGNVAAPQGTVTGTPAGLINSQPNASTVTGTPAT